MSAGQTPIFCGAYASRALLLPLAVYAAVWWRQAQCDITIRFGPELRCKKVRSLPSGTSRLVQLSQGSTWCCIDGDDNPGRLVVLVHGFSGSSGYFEFLAECLARSNGRRRVLRFDLYGRGGSSCTGAPHTPRLFAGQLAELLFALKEHGPIDLVGYSMGGAIAAQFAAAYPDTDAVVKNSSGTHFGQFVAGAHHGYAEYHHCCGAVDYYLFEQGNEVHSTYMSADGQYCSYDRKACGAAHAAFVALKVAAQHAGLRPPHMHARTHARNLTYTHACARVCTCCPCSVRAPRLRTRTVRPVCVAHRRRTRGASPSRPRPRPRCESPSHTEPVEYSCDACKVCCGFLTSTHASVHALDVEWL